MKIILTGGGTGGHVFPLLAVARELKSLYLQKKIEESRNVFGEKSLQPKNGTPDFQLYYVGPADEFGLVSLSQEGIAMRVVSAGKIRRYLNLQSLGENLRDIFWRVPRGIFQSLWILFFLAPDVVFSKGGYGSFPVVLSAWLLRVPIFLHESDVDPGLTNKILAIFARKIFVSFPKTERFPLSKMILVGNPVRREIIEGTLAEAQEIFKLGGGKPVIFILGGSQGSQRINELILNILPELAQGFEVIHQVGEKNFKQFQAEAEITCPPALQPFYHAFPFLREEEYKQALAAADLVVSRASAGAIFEIAAANKPSILIPLPEAAQDHQVKNAYAYQAQGAAVVLEEANLTPHFFLDKLNFLFSHSDELDKMRRGAESFARINAARDIAKYLFSLLMKD